MGRARRSYPEDAAALVELEETYEEAERVAIQEGEDDLLIPPDAPIGEPIIESMEEARDLFADGSLPIFSVDPESPTGFRDEQGRPIDPETGEVWEGDF